MPLLWQEARCSEGDPTEPAHWRLLHVTPFDGGVVGVGELEGRAVGLEEAKDIAADDATASIGRDLVGRGRDAVVRLVEAARPGRAETYLPPAPCA